MISIEHFRTACLEKTVDQILDDIIFVENAAHVSCENIKFIRTRICERFNVDEVDVTLYVVGSAHLGFSLVEKSQQDGLPLPRYRAFGPRSDIDTLVISSKIFHTIWQEISAFAHGHSFMPWNSGRLGDYLIYGWLRPDHFPKSRIVRHYNDWWEEYHRLSADPRFNRRKVRGGLFYSFEDARRYQRRAVMDCIHFEEAQQ